MGSFKTGMSACVLTGLLAGIAQGETGGVRLTSESYRISGQIDGWSSQTVPYHDSFEQAAAAPISHALAPLLYPYARGESRSEATAGPFSLAVHARSADGVARASAGGEWEFTAEGHLLKISLDWGQLLNMPYFQDAGYSFGLTDITTGDSLLSISSNTPAQDFWDRVRSGQWKSDYSFPVNRNHTYHVEMSLWGRSSGDTTASTFAPSVSVNPEPASLALLAWGGVLALRRPAKRK